MNQRHSCYGTALRALSLVFLGAMLCVVVEIGMYGYERIKHPLGGIKNLDFDLIQVADHSGDHLFDLHKGEFRFLPYGVYKLSIPNSKVSFTVWKNNRGSCYIHSADGVLLVETDGNSGIGNPY